MRRSEWYQCEWWLSKADADLSDFIKKQLFYKTDRFSFGAWGVGGGGCIKMDLMRTRPWKKEVLRVELSERSYPTMA